MSKPTCFPHADPLFCVSNGHFRLHMQAQQSMSEGPVVSAFARVSSLPIPEPDADPEPDSWEAFTDHSPRGGTAGAPLDGDEEDREGAATEGAQGAAAVAAAGAAEDTGAS